MAVVAHRTRIRLHSHGRALATDRTRFRHSRSSTPDTRQKRPDARRRPVRDRRTPVHDRRLPRIPATPTRRRESRADRRISGVSSLTFKVDFAVRIDSSSGPACRRQCKVHPSSSPPASSSRYRTTLLDYTLYLTRTHLHKKSPRDRSMSTHDHLRRPSSIAGSAQLSYY